MPPTPHPPPRWYAIPVPVLLLTFIGTLVSFAVSLLVGIVAIVVVSSLRHVNPNMTVAYRHIALPTALVSASIIFALALTMEIRHYRQSKTLTEIERVS